ncbi:hypothetical protein, variant [Exophiala dermatitidis NIH/UT8656]|uniref:Uncharacterized protein n=1 Tax=Exophiala dermatitidis (strain ATCC 34100 / CBS 525.76 / NIH/UT8656) TaxID=858893 RepID=H6BWL0_EXODN|nr:uncharacterized protein HMPREF1120_04175 [Exophiala dermatitidis NIH/UT8656]XP_009156533.1 hypothetical protein, variant [Exophiala dermatitidis NIH/UT8656]EHY56071.1 hypothetical protein, variant [Exophiala dermatitidis NIH/UT8656]EHY56072.1 hypothetical protein HMPREF1120_04175 [Exophiala dermatitidis NIH/UT8656]
MTTLRLVRIKSLQVSALPCSQSAVSSNPRSRTRTFSPSAWPQGIQASLKLFEPFSLANMAEYRDRQAKTSYNGHGSRHRSAVNLHQVGAVLKGLDNGISLNPSTYLRYVYQLQLDGFS